MDGGEKLVEETGNAREVNATLDCVLCQIGVQLVRPELTTSGALDFGNKRAESSGKGLETTDVDTNRGEDVEIALELEVNIDQELNLKDVVADGIEKGGEVVPARDTSSNIAYNG